MYGVQKEGEQKKTEGHQNSILTSNRRRGNTLLQLIVETMCANKYRLRSIFARHSKKWKTETHQLCTQESRRTEYSTHPCSSH